MPRKIFVMLNENSEQVDLTGSPSNTAMFARFFCVFFRSHQLSFVPHLTSSEEGI